MTLILNIETSTKVCSVSIGLNGKLIAYKEESSDKYIHSEKLNLFIEDVFTQTEYELKDLAAVCVTKGPGSYTGLRIGVSCAKGLCYALDVPLISVDSLTALAAAYSASNELKDDAVIIPMIDARRMEVFTACYDSKGKQTEAISAKIIDNQSFDKTNTIVLIGDGAEKCGEVISSNIVIDNHLSSSKGMVTISYEKFLASNFEDVAYFEPFYLKDFIAG